MRRKRLVRIVDMNTPASRTQRALHSKRTWHRWKVGSSAHVFASGMAAISALVAMLKTGDHVICGSNVYGGTPRLFDRIIANYGILFTYVDTTDLEAVRRAIQPNTRLLHIETPTNPMMQITDMRAIADLCRERRRAGQAIDLSVDNTFMSPYFQRPIEFGADIVMHSTTKFLNGHSDGLGGSAGGDHARAQGGIRLRAEMHWRHSVSV